MKTDDDECDFGSAIDEELDKLNLSTKTFKLKNGTVTEFTEKLAEPLAKIFNNYKCDVVHIDIYQIRKEEMKKLWADVNKFDYIRHFMQANLFIKDMQKYLKHTEKFNETQIENIEKIRQHARKYRDKIYWELKDTKIPAERDLYYKFEMTDMEEIVNEIEQFHNYKLAQVSKHIEYLCN